MATTATENTAAMATATRAVATAAKNVAPVTY